MDSIGELGALGPFFSAEFHNPRSAVHGSWRAMSGLVEQPHTLDERVAQVRASLAARHARRGGLVRDAREFADVPTEELVEVRVAASVMHLGMVARLVAPLFALAVLHRRCFPIGLAQLRWQPIEGSLFPLSLPEIEDTEQEPCIAGEVGLAPLVADGCAVAELSTACERFDVNGHILRGNVASAFGGAAAALARARPDQAPAIRLALSEVLALPALEDASHLEPGGRLRRHSCCLIYRASPARDGGMCGDCPLPLRSVQRRA